MLAHSLLAFVKSTAMAYKISQLSLKMPAVLEEG
jgi:hypothetical protein